MAITLGISPHEYARVGVHERETVLPHPSGYVIGGVAYTVAARHILIGSMIIVTSSIVAPVVATPIVVRLIPIV